MTPEQAEELWAVVKKVGYAFDSNSVILCVPNELVTYIDGAIQKGIALPPKTEDNEHYCCPNCGQFFGKKRKYCHECGQRLKWSDNK